MTGVQTCALPIYVHKADVSLKNLIIYNALQGNQDAEYRDGAYHVDILPQDNVSVTANTTLRDMYVRIGVLKKPASTDSSYAEYLRKASNYANDDPDIVWLEWVKATNTYQVLPLNTEDASTTMVKVQVDCSRNYSQSAGECFYYFS